MCATVIEHEDTCAADVQLVVVAMSRAPGPFPSMEALLAWSGGLGSLYDELQLRFPHAAAIGVSARLAAIRPFPFASGCTMMTACVVTAVASAPSALVTESVVLGVRNATNVVVRTLSHKGAPCPILCLEGVTREQFPNMMQDVPLSSLPSIRGVEYRAFERCASLQSVCLANLPLLESIDNFAFGECPHLSTVDLSNLPSLRTIGGCTFWQCESLQSISLANLPLFESIHDYAFKDCVHLSSLDLSQLPALRTIGSEAFQKCESLQSISLANLPLLESVDSGAFRDCVHLSFVDFSSLPSLRWITNYAFSNCESLQSISFSNLPLLESIGERAFFKCAHLSSVNYLNSQLSALLGRKLSRNVSLFNRLASRTYPARERWVVSFC